MKHEDHEDQEEKSPGMFVATIAMTFTKKVFFVVFVVFVVPALISQHKGK